MTQNRPPISNTALAICGLDIEYWQAVIDKHVQQFKFRHEETFDILIEFARDEWEKVSLRDFLQLQPKKGHPLGTERVSLARKVLLGRQNASREYLRKKQEQRLLLPRLNSSGVLFTNNIKTCLEPREIVLEGKSHATLNYTESCPSETSVNSTSKHQQDLFRKALTQIGYQAAVSIKGDAWGLHNQAKCIITENEDTASDSCPKENEKYTILETAFYKVDKETVSLSATFIEELKDLENEIKGTEEVKQIQDKCESFIKRFGSHVNYSTVEFGGICQDATSTDNGEARLVRDALGTQHVVEEYDTWVRGVRDNMDRWQVTNRGKDFSKDFKAIWDLILDHEPHLQNPEQMSYELQQTWIHRFSHTLLSKGETEIDLVVQGLCPGTYDDHQEVALEHLHLLYSAVVYACLETGNTIYWTNIYEYRKHVQDLIAYISKIQEPDGIVKYTQNLAADLLELSGHTGCKLGCLPPTLQGHNMNDIPGVLKGLNDVFVPQLAKDNVGEIKSHVHIAIMATKDLSLIFEHTKLELEAQNKYHDVSLLISIFNLLVCSSLFKFGKVVNPDDIEQALEKITEIWQTFEKYQSPSMDLEAYLIHLHLTTKQQYPENVPSVWNPLGSKMDDAFKDIIISAFRSKELLEVLQDKKRTASVSHHFPKDNHRTELQMLFNHLGLEKYSEGKITMEDVIGREYDLRDIKPTDIPWVFLKQMMLLDPNVMDYLAKCVISETEKEADSHRQKNEDTAAAGTAADNDSDDKKNDPHAVDNNDGMEEANDDIDWFEEEQKTADPLDVFWSVFICCDLPLRQILVKNMHLCNFAVPLFFPLKSNDKVTYSLWPMRNISLGRDHFGGSLVNQPLNIVSFLRFRRPKFSKTNYLRSILRQQDEMFLSCDDADEERMAADGFIDCFVNTPTDEQNGTSTIQLMYLNLHGDAANHAYEKQVEILGKVSDTVIACIDNADLADEEVVNAVKTLTGLPSQVIVLLQDRNIKALTKPKFKRLWEDFSSKIGKIKVKRVLGFQGNKDRNAIEIKDSIKEAISKSLEARKGKRLVDIPDIISAECIHIDEQDEKCQHTRKQAEKVVASVRNSHLKSRELLRDRPPSDSRAVRESDGHVLRGQIKDISDQKESSESMNSTDDFLLGLTDAFATNNVEFYLSWLRLLADEKNQDGNDKCGGVGTSPTDIDIPGLFEDVIKVYELKRSTGMKISADLKNALDQLPEVLAHLLLKGHPIPLLTDDMQELPINLIVAMFTYLEVILENQKLFTMFVFGRPLDHVKSMFGFGHPKHKNGLYLHLTKVNDPIEKSINFSVVLEVRGEPGTGKAFSLGVCLADVCLFNCTGDGAKDSYFLQNTLHTWQEMSPSDMLKQRKHLYVTKKLVEGDMVNTILEEEIKGLFQRPTTATGLAVGAKPNDNIALNDRKRVWNLMDSIRGDIAVQENYNQVLDIRTTIYSDVVRAGLCSLYFSDFSNMLIDMWDAVRSEWSEVKFQNTCAAKALHIIQKHLSALQCALGCNSVHAGPQQGGTELFLLASQQHEMTDKKRLEILSKIQNSPLPLKYLRLLKRYLNKDDSMIRQRERRHHKDKVDKTEEQTEKVMRDHKKENEKILRHQVAQNQKLDSSLKDKIKKKDKRGKTSCDTPMRGRGTSEDEHTKMQKKSKGITSVQTTSGRPGKKPRWK